jgi:hypothetical protein
VAVKPLDFWQCVKEISLFFDGKDEVHKSMRRLVRRLDKAGIPYAIMGGIAVYAHRYRRTTDDLDVLLRPEGLAEFRRLFVPKHYATTPNRSRRFVDKQNQITLDVLVAGYYPGSGVAGPITFPDPADVAESRGKVQVIDLPTLVQLKLAARRYQDFADVVNLIRFNELDESFQDHLHASVRHDYIECVEEKRREDEYDALQ